MPHIQLLFLFQAVTESEDWRSLCFTMVNVCTISSYFLKSNYSALKFYGLGHSSPVHSLQSPSFVANKYFPCIISLVLLCFSITILFHLLCGPDDRHASASTFTRNVEIFQKMFLFTPVCRRYFLQFINVYS